LENWGHWLTSSSDSISLFVRHVKEFRIFFASRFCGQLPYFLLPLAPMLCSNLTGKGPDRIRSRPLQSLVTGLLAISPLGDAKMKMILCVALLCLLAALTVVPFVSHSSAANALPGQGGGVIYCASDDGRRKICPANTGGGIQLTKQRSDSPCVFGQTWGYDRNGIWVDRGCRAEFVAGYYGGGPGGGPGGPAPGWPGWGNNYNVYCASDNGRRISCPVDTSGGVRLVRKRSESPCVYGSSWGYDRRGIWVDRGCRALKSVNLAGSRRKQGLFIALRTI
jgi:hypothetical protein